MFDALSGALGVADSRVLIAILDLLFIATFAFLKRWVPHDLRLPMSLVMGACIGLAASVLGGDPELWDIVVTSLVNAAAPAGFYHIKEAYAEGRSLRAPPG